MPREKKVEEYDVVIIGGGAAGMTAGIYCGRARLKTLIIEMALVGGLATYTNEIENYPGFPEGSTGLGLMELFQQQTKKFDVKFKGTDVKSVELEGEVKIVETFRTTYKAKVVIIASGGRPRITNAENEEEFLFDKGISFCATCDAAANTDKDVLIIGSGDAAIEEGMFLTKFANKVYISIMHEDGKMDCNEIAKSEACENSKMEFIWNTVVKRFEGDNHLRTVVLENLRTGEEIPIDIDTCFEFIGYIPNTEIFKDQICLSERGYVLVNDKMETNIEGVFSAGDVNEKFLKQIATAVGDGAVAGYAAERYIAETAQYSSQILTRDHFVYVYDASCVNCQNRLREIEALEVETNGKISFSKVDVYKSKGLSNRMGVSVFPSIAVVRSGEIVDVLTDDFSRVRLESYL
ncbi:MAG: FAD-dependent oxidoreductase [Spirochaetales bacterium]|nr:FAD-dependent oxidoreductase [Spirochaetales bacterium]